MNLSFWETETYFKNIDVTIIGSGIVGLNAALYLKLENPSLKIIVLERGMLPSGASTKNAGFACFGSCTELLDDLKNHTEEEVFSLVEKRLKGLKRLRKNLGDKQIDYKNWGGYEIFDDRQAYNEAVKKMDYLNKQLRVTTGIKDVYRTADRKIRKFGFKNIHHIIENTAEGQIDTGKMMLALIKLVQKKGVVILNSVGVKSFSEEGKNVKITTDNGISYTAKRLLIATNGFAKQLLPNYPVVPARAQVIITSPIKNLKIKGTFHYDKGYYYFRNIGNRVLFGGGRNLDFKKEETTEAGLTELVQKKLEKLLRTTILPDTDYVIDQRWSGIMGMGSQKKAIVKSVSKNVFCAVRMGGMGVAIGSLVGEEGANLVNQSL